MRVGHNSLTLLIPLVIISLSQLHFYANGSAVAPISKPKSKALHNIFSVTSSSAEKGFLDHSAVKDATKMTASFGAFVLMDWSLKKAFVRLKINFPSSLCGMMLIFFSLLGLNKVNHLTAAKIADFLDPGADQLAKWLPTFFVPGVVMMPLSPPVSVDNILKLLFINSAGLVANFAFSSNVANLLIKLNKRKGDSSVAGAPGKPARIFPFKMGQQLLVVSAITCALACKVNNQQLYTIGLLTSTLGGFVCALHMPASIKCIISPFIVSSIIGMLTCALCSAFNGMTFKDMIRNYTRKRGGLEMGAGDILLFLLGPSILSFGLSMFHRRRLMAENFAAVIGTNLFSAIFSLLGTALLARVIGLKEILRTSTVMRNVTMALGIPLFDIIQGSNISVAVAMIILTGILGQNFGQIILNRLKVTNPVARGLSMGISGHGLGTAALATTEKEAFAFSALAMALNGSFAVCLTAIPLFRKLIFALAGL